MTSFNTPDTTSLDDDNKTLDDYHIPTNSTLYFASSLDSQASLASPSPAPSTASSSPAKKSRKRCTFKSCISAPLRGVGDCVFCEGHFCSKHRLLEQHDCVGLQNCKQQLHERNAVKLHQQQTVANKV
ncbi:Tmc1p [Sugiyamaella lignohabitans]|uniref:Tmc1p n=1 Tax=Sugiyamaella lignohabitans TaxID=796027 RepID=A0A161HI03_9ASCO|nr:Tmc1p [Sugiyamaella lignohabitans]ANB15820.1 Tmc1p [Sugiyamaella lignohabitans]